MLCSVFHHTVLMTPCKEECLTARGESIHKTLISFDTNQFIFTKSSPRYSFKTALNIYLPLSLGCLSPESIHE